MTLRRPVALQETPCELSRKAPESRSVPKRTPVRRVLVPRHRAVTETSGINNRSRHGEMSGINIIQGRGRCQKSASDIAQEYVRHQNPTGHEETYRETTGRIQTDRRRHESFTVHIQRAVGTPAPFMK